MEKMTIYVVVDYSIARKNEVLTALCCCSKDGASLRFYDSYNKAQSVASDWLNNGRDGVAIIPIEIDTDNISCLFTKRIVETVKLNN